MGQCYTQKRGEEFKREMRSKVYGILKWYEDTLNDEW